MHCNVMVMMLVIELLLATSPAMGADHWSKWFKPGMDMGGKRNFYPAERDPYNYRVNRPDLEINKGFGEISSSQTENENQRISLMTLLRVLAAASANDGNRHEIAFTEVTDFAFEQWENLRMFAGRK